MIGDEMDDPQLGDLAVWVVYNPPRTPHLYPVKTALEAKRMIYFMAKAHSVTEKIESNAFGLVEWNGEEWLEWKSKETGEQIDEWRE